ncbi:hypothetical protein RUM43_000004 [Polyplax serrata]|uniref:E3 ubiquitin-protein ligase CHFR n=1 Tax=Polyplax serrata TaxID=468196 RepID=A0AAN8SF86_POLSC
MQLAVLKGWQKENDVVVDTVPFTIGRCLFANFIISHVNISRNHCHITYENSLWKINDLSSSGTYVNGKLIGRGSSEVVRDGDVIKFGTVGNEFQWTFHGLNHCMRRNDRKVLAIPVSPSTDTYKHVIQYNISKGTELGSEIRGTDKKLDVTARETEGIVSDKQVVSQGQKNYEQKIKLHQQLEQTNINGNEYQNSEYQLGNHNQKENEENMNFIVVQSDKKVYCGENTTELLLREIKDLKSTLSDLQGKYYTLMDELAKANSKQNEVFQNKLEIKENFTELIETELQCTICSELFVNTVTLGCTHSFCQFCLQQWKEKQKTCPICRKSITVETGSLIIDSYIDKMVEYLSGELKHRRDTLIKERTQSLPPPKKKLKIRIHAQPSS